MIESQPGLSFQTAAAQALPKKAPVLTSLTTGVGPVQSGPWPTSPVLVSSKEKQTPSANFQPPEKHKLQVEQINFDAVKIETQKP